MWFGYIAPAYRSGEGGGILLVHLKTICLRGALRMGGSQHPVGSVCTADGSWVGGGGGGGGRATGGAQHSSVGNGAEGECLVIIGAKS